MIPARVVRSSEIVPEVMPSSSTIEHQWQSVNVPLANTPPTSPWDNQLG